MSSGADAPPADQGLLSITPEELPSGRLKRYLRWLATGYRDEPAPSRLGVLEAFDPDRMGVCCSGGGIRSASFNLGALQALRHERELGRATYIAAVSGGSYIAGSVCMVAKTWPAGEPRPRKGERGDDDSATSSMISGYAASMAIRKATECPEVLKQPSPR